MDDNPFDLREYLRVILKHKWVVILIASAAVAGTALWTLRQPKIFETFASLKVDATPPQVLRDVQEVVELGPGNAWRTQQHMADQVKIIKSHRLGVRVVQKLGLGHDPAFASLDEDALADQVLSRIRVEVPKESQFMYLYARDVDPQRAVMYANAFAEVFIEQNLDFRVEGTRSAVDWLTDQLASLKDRLEASENALYRYKKDQDILSTSLEDKQNITSQRLVTLNEELTRVQTRRVELEAKRAQAQTMSASGDWAIIESFPPVAHSATVQSLKLRVHDEQQQVAELSERYGDQHPTLMRAHERQTQALSALRSEVKKILDSSEAEYDEAVDTERKLVALIEQVKREAFEVNKREIDYVRLKREVDSNQRLYEMVLKRQKDADLTAMNRANNVALVDVARLPNTPISPNVRANLMFGLLLGLLGGVALALLLEFLDHTIKTQEDVEKHLGVAFLGVLPTIAGDARDLFIHLNSKSQVAECCRSIRTSLFFMSPDRPLKRMLVTSPGPMEGKTTTAIQLAIIMAQAGSKTLLVDSDMRRPRIHRAFGVPNERGMSTLVLGEATLDDVIKTTEVPNLFVLPCGPLPPQPAELLHAARFKEIGRLLDERFDRVIYDSPPVGAVADGAILAASVDGVILVLRAQRTSKEMAKTARRKLQDVKAHIFGAVLNDLDLESRRYGYAYQYYRQYGAYYGEKKDTA